MPQKVLWIRRQRVLRRLLRKYRAAKKIDKHQYFKLFWLYLRFAFFHRYHEFYLASKGNQFKNKKVLIEAIHKSKQEKIKSDKLNQQQEARRMKNQEYRKKKVEKKQAGKEEQHKA